MLPGQDATIHKRHKLIRIGAWHWHTPAWRTHFYPADIDASACLRYYARYYRCAVLSEATWLQDDMPDAEDWLEEVDEDFRFFQHITRPLLEHARWPLILDALADLEGQLGGVLVEYDGGEEGAAIERVLAQHLPRQTIHALPGAGLPNARQIWTLRAGPDGGALLGVMRPPPGLGSLQLKTYIEDFAHGCTTREAYLLLDAHPRIVAEAATLVRLLGY